MDSQSLNRVTGLEEWIGAFFSQLAKLIYIALQAFCLLALLPFKCLARLLCICRPTKKEYRSILITGASSGIGAELARQYAKPDVRLVLVARRKGKLEQVKQACESRGATVELLEADVTERAKLQQAILSADDKQPLDLIIANAGLISHSLHDQVEDPHESDFPVTNINIVGTVNTIDCMIPRMKEREVGQIAIMSSVASYTPSADPWWTAYHASKMWGRCYGEGLRGALDEYNVGVTVICPGFVKSEMVDDIAKGTRVTNCFPIAYLCGTCNCVTGSSAGAIDTDKAVRVMMDAIAWNKGVCTIPATPTTFGVVWFVAYNIIPSFVTSNLNFIRLTRWGDEGSLHSTDAMKRPFIKDEH